MAFVRNPAIFSRLVKGKWFILEKDKLHYRELNETAGFLWSLVENPVEKDRLVALLATEYSQPTENVFDDVGEFLEEYLKLGFLVRQD